MRAHQIAGQCCGALCDTPLDLYTASTLSYTVQRSPQQRLCEGRAVKVKFDTLLNQYPGWELTVCYTGARYLSCSHDSGYDSSLALKTKDKRKPKRGEAAEACMAKVLTAQS